MIIGSDYYLEWLFIIEEWFVIIMSGYLCIIEEWFVIIRSGYLCIFK